MDCLSDGKDLQICFLHCGGPVKLMQVFLCARNDRESRFHHCGGLVKLVQDCLSARKDLQISFSTVEGL